MADDGREEKAEAGAGANDAPPPAVALGSPPSGGGTSLLARLRPGRRPVDGTAPGSAEYSAGRDADLDGVRALAMVLVWVYHGLLVATPLQHYILPDGLRLRASMHIFFVLSGFLIYQPFARAHLTGRRRPRLVDYARRRALRIYPAYLVAYLALWALGWIDVGEGSRFVGELTLTQGYQALDQMTQPGIEPAWTLCVEVSFYVLVPLWAALVRWAGVRVGALRAEVTGGLALLAVGVGTVWWDHVGEPSVLLSVLFPELPTLASGMLLAIVVAGGTVRPGIERAVRRLPPPVVWWGAAVAVLVWMPGRPTTWPGTSTQWFVDELSEMAFGILVAAPVMLGLTRRGAIGRGLSSRPVAWLGVISYGIYLWHYDVMNDMATGLWDKGETTALCGLALIAVLSLVVGALSHYLIERPALLFARRRERRGRDQGSGPGPAQPGRGENMMTATPTRQTAAPARS